MKYTRRVVEEAAELLSAAASNDVWLETASLSINSSIDVYSLALEASIEAHRRCKGCPSTYAYAEAEALLRTGWRPQ